MNQSRFSTAAIARAVVETLRIHPEAILERAGANINDARGQSLRDLPDVGELVIALLSAPA